MKRKYRIRVLTFNGIKEFYPQYSYLGIFWRALRTTDPQHNRICRTSDGKYEIYCNNLDSAKEIISKDEKYFEELNKKTPKPKIDYLYKDPEWKV